MDSARLQKIEDRLAIEDLNTAFCDHLDNNRVQQLAALFTEDVYYRHGTRVSEGREAVHALFGKRSETPRTARHMYTGLSVEFTSENSAKGHSVCMTFAQDGLPPITPALPYLVADFFDEYRREDDGQWRISRRVIERIFVAEGNSGPIGATSK